MWIAVHHSGWCFLFSCWHTCLLSACQHTHTHICILLIFSIKRMNSRYFMILKCFNYGKMCVHAKKYCTMNMSNIVLSCCCCCERWPFRAIDGTKKPPWWAFEHIWTGNNRCSRTHTNIGYWYIKPFDAITICLRCIIQYLFAHFKWPNWISNWPFFWWKNAFLFSWAVIPNSLAVPISVVQYRPLCVHQCALFNAIRPIG